MISSECVPFFKTGGLADVVGALSLSFAQQKQNVQVILPDYNAVSKNYKKVCSFNIPMLGCIESIIVKSVEVNNVIFYFICHSVFTDRLGIYGDTSVEPYADNFYRYILFSKAALELCKVQKYTPDIIHAHDWPTGFIPYLMKHSGMFFANTRCVFTIHNLAYQGIFSKLNFLYLNIKPDVRLLKNDSINMLYAGLVSSDYISTVSPTYAEQIKTSDFDCGLGEILNKRSSHLIGIVNGVDLNVWNPSKDKYLTEHYSKNDLTGKIKLKKHLQKTFNLPIALDIPIFAMIGRLAAQKGFDIFLECAEYLLNNYRLQFVIIGTGDRFLVDRLLELDSKFDNISVAMEFSDEKAHLVEAGSDFFLMPSRYEPCGLNQMYSQIYGTIPVVHKTGGLSDTVIDISDDPKNGTGIVFNDLEPNSIVSSVGKACELYKSDKMKNVINNAMSTDFSWNKSAHLYMNLYESLLKGKYRSGGLKK